MRRIFRLVNSEFLISELSVIGVMVFQYKHRITETTDYTDYTDLHRWVLLPSAVRRSEACDLECGNLLLLWDDLQLKTKAATSRRPPKNFAAPVTFSSPHSCCWWKV